MKEVFIMATRPKMLVVLASAMLLLAACGDKNEATTDTTDNKPETVTEETNSNSSKEVAEKENTTAEDSTKTEAASSTESPTTPAKDTEEKESTTATTEDSTKTEAAKKSTSSEASEKVVVTVNPVHKDFLQNQLKTARNGMTEGVPFESGESLFEDVTTAWGEPTTKFSNGTNYIEYAKNGVVEYAFGIGRGDRLYDVRTFVAPDDSFKLSDISFDEIIKVVGKPTSITTSGNDRILNYKAGANILKFVGPSTTEKLHHISIFNQKSSEPMGGRE